MTKKKNNRRLEDSLSEAINPKPKTDRLGAANSLLDIYRPVSKELAEEEASEASTSTRATTPTRTPTSTPPTYSIAPTSNFQKVTNTITKEAIPQRLFRTGKTKEIYDVLYSLTRGAIVPRRSVVISKPKLRQLTGVGSRVTIDACLGYLEVVNLIRITKNSSGQHDGNEYEVFTPEEIGISTPISTGTSSPGSTPTSHAQTLGVVAGVDNRRPSTGSNPVNIDLSEQSKTTLNTKNKIDDEAYNAIERFKNAVRNVTGVEPTEKDLQAFASICDLVIDITAVAATKTKVTSYGQFALTNLQRRLATTKPQCIEKAKPFEPGKDELIIEAEVFTPDPLSEQGREMVLDTLRRMPREEANGYEDHYTTEDWEWLVEKLG